MGIPAGFGSTGDLRMAEISSIITSHAVAVCLESQPWRGGSRKKVRLAWAVEGGALQPSKTAQSQMCNDPDFRPSPENKKQAFGRNLRFLFLLYYNHFIIMVVVVVVVVIVSVCACACMDMPSEEVREHLSGVSPLLLPCRFQELKSGSWAPWQVPLPPEPSPSPTRGN